MSKQKKYKGFESIVLSKVMNENFKNTLDALGLESAEDSSVVEMELIPVSEMYNGLQSEVKTFFTEDVDPEILAFCQYILEDFSVAVVDLGEGAFEINLEGGLKYFAKKYFCELKKKGDGFYPTFLESEKIKIYTA